MNEKIVGWLAIAVILLVGGWVYKSDLLTEQQLQALAVFLLISGLAYRAVALRVARLTVLKRRRLYKELWRRGDKPGFDPNRDMTRAEEEGIVLLGRIKGAKPTTLVMAAATIGALLFHANYLALVIALGQLFLATRLHLTARTLDRALPADADRKPLDGELPQSTSDRYLVVIDIRKVHDFIQPRLALPFWEPTETEQWLARCGFKWTEGRKWDANRSSLSYLDADEVLSLEPADG